MSFRLRAAITVLVFLIFANLGWRIWARWGLITIHGDNVPLSKVIRSIEQQGGITLVSNAGPDATVTMHVRQVPLLRALQVLSINTGGRWALGYVLAPDKASIRAFFEAFATGGETAGWKKFAVPTGGMPGGGGAGDPREDPWAAAATGANLQSYLEQGAQYVNAQFWAPEEWNPVIAKSPGAGLPAAITQNLAAAAHGESREVFFLSVPTRSPDKAMAGEPADGPPKDGPPGDGGPGGMPNAATTQAMDLREQARIDRLPAARKAEAQAKFDARKKFLADMTNLSPEERREKMQARIEEDMRSSGPGPFEARMTQFDAMHTVEQRANFFRMVVKFKEGAAK